MNNKDVLFEKLNKIKKFERAEDVIDLPKYDNIDDWRNEVVPELIKRGAIPKSELEDGVWYYGDFRNSYYGKWDAESETFGHWRNKFGWRWDTCKHFEDEIYFACFTPLRKATIEEIKMEEEKEESNINYRKLNYE